MSDLYKRYINGEVEIEDLTYGEFKGLIDEWVSSLEKAGGSVDTVKNTLKKHRATVGSKKEKGMIDRWLSE